MLESISHRAWQGRVLNEWPSGLCLVLWLTEEGQCAKVGAWRPSQVLPGRGSGKAGIHLLGGRDPHPNVGAHVSIWVCRWPPLDYPVVGCPTPGRSPGLTFRW